MTFAEKVKIARQGVKMTQHELSTAIGVSRRTIASYETGRSKPRGAILWNLAASLKVSSDYLLLDEVDDPREGIEKVPYVKAIRDLYGSHAAAQVDDLLNQDRALFAGGKIHQDSKDAFFEAIMKAYITVKDREQKKELEASGKF